MPFRHLFACSSSSFGYVLHLELVKDIEEYTLAHSEEFCGGELFLY